MMRIYSAIFNLIGTWDRFLTFSFFSSCKRLEHPIVFIIFTSVFLIWRRNIVSYNSRLDRPFEFVLFSFSLRLLTRISLMYSLRRSYDLFTLIIVWPCSCVTLSRTHQPFIYFFITLKYTFIIWSTIVRSQSTFLSNYKIYFCHNWSVPARIFSRWRWWLWLKLRLPINCDSSCSRALSANPWNNISCLSSLFKFNLNCSLLFRNRQTTSSSLKWKLKYSSISLSIYSLVISLAVSSCILVLVVAWSILLSIYISVLFLDVIFFDHLYISWFWWIENWRWRIISQMQNFLGDWGYLLMMSLLLIMIFIWAHSCSIRVHMLVNILNILN